MTASDDIARRSRELRGTPAEMAARLGELIGTSPRTLADGAGLAERMAHRRSVETHSGEIAALRHRLATDFGAARGWKLTGRQFDVSALSGRKATNRGRVVKTDWPHSYADHPYRYVVGRQPVALVSHPYGISAAKPGDVVAWADASGLKVSFPDFPSWHYPGSTALVLFEAVSGPAAQLEPPPPPSTAGRGSSMHPLRRLLVLGLNEVLARDRLSLDGKMSTVGGHLMVNLAGRPSVVSWSDAGFEEVRLSVWWGYDHSQHPQANHEGPYREAFNLPEPLAKRSHYPKFVGVTVSGWLERKTGAWLQGRKREKLFAVYVRPDLRPHLDAIPDPVPQGFSAEGKFFL